MRAAFTPVRAVVVVSLALLLAVDSIRGQTARPGDGSAQGAAVPPAGGIVSTDHPYAIGLGLGSYRWDEEAPYDDLVLASLTIERQLWRGVRGRAGLGAGVTHLAADGPVDTDLYVIDLQVLAGPDFGAFRAIGVLPYALAGVGSLVSNPSSEGERDLPTRSQSQFTYGGGVLARVLERWEARAEVSAANLRLANPFDGEDRDTDTVQNLRWEGRLSWLF